MLGAVTLYRLHRHCRPDSDASRGAQRDGRRAGVAGLGPGPDRGAAGRPAAARIWAGRWMSQPQGNDGLRLLLTDATGQAYDAGTFPPTNTWHPTGVWQPGQAWRGQIGFRLPIQAQPGQAQLAAQLVDAERSAARRGGHPGPIRVLPTDRVFTAPQPQVPRRGQPGRQGDPAGRRPAIRSGCARQHAAPDPVLAGARARWMCPIPSLCTCWSRAGRCLSQDNSEPAGGVRPTTGWVPGEYVTDPHELLCRRICRQAIYVIEVGMYDAGARGLPRLAILDSESQGTTDRVISGPIQVTDRGGIP